MTSVILSNGNLTAYHGVHTWWKSSGEPLKQSCCWPRYLTDHRVVNCNDRKPAEQKWILKPYLGDNGKSAKVSTVGWSDFSFFNSTTIYNGLFVYFGPKSRARPNFQGQGQRSIFRATGRCPRSSAYNLRISKNF